MSSKAQIIATLGTTSCSVDVIQKMIEAGMDIARLNFAWGSLAEMKVRIEAIRIAAKKAGRPILIIQDLPGPRIQAGASHSYDKSAPRALTEEDKIMIEFGAEHRIDYVGLSFTGSASDVWACRKAIEKSRGKQHIIAKIERMKAVEEIDEIIETADAVMIARGDLGAEVPLEKIPFIQAMIIEKADRAGKPVIVATQMMLSMTDSLVPTRAEVTDVAAAILLGADAVMLSEETASGKYPVEAVAMMEKIVVESENHLKNRARFHHL